MSNSKTLIYCYSIEIQQDATEINGKTHEDNNSGATNGHIQLEEKQKEGVDAKQNSNEFIKIEKNAIRKKRDTSADRSLKVISFEFESLRSHMYMYSVQLCTCTFAVY